MRLLTTLIVSILLAFQVSAQQSGKKLSSTTYVVTSSGDEPDSDLEDGIFDPPTLRSAIENANKVSGLGIISFSGITSVLLTNTLPAITEEINIDGDLPNGGRIIIDGSGIASDIDRGLVLGIDAEGSQIFKVSLVSFDLGAIGVFADFVSIDSSFIGTADGQTAQPNGDQFVPQTTPAIFIKGDQVNLTGNVISGNYGYGIQISTLNDSLVTTIENNIIGLDSSGNTHLGNSSDGIHSNTGIQEISGNVISDNGGHGIRIGGDQYDAIEEVLISSNIIGLDKTGTKERGNEFSGILSERALVRIEGNYISHNLNGIDSRGDSVTIRNNFIGTDINGVIDFGNEKAGIVLTGNHSTIGGDDAEQDWNLISGNDEEGILVTSNYSTIKNNFIGVNVYGDSALANNFEGIRMQGSNTGINVITNVISGNGRDGIEIGDTNYEILIKGNLIGTDDTGTKVIGNLENGIILENGSNIEIGGAEVASRNVISNNGLFGIQSWISTTELDTLDEITIQNNFIGLDKSGSKPMGNNLSGISSASWKSVIFDNVISANKSSGLSIEGQKNRIYSNFIGSDSTGSISMGNQNHGIELKADSNFIGTGIDDSFGNLIVDNGFSGILVFSFSNGNSIANNLIGIDYNGTAGLGNFHSGVTVGTNSSGNEIFNNVISGNRQHGLRLIGNNTSTRITANYIGTDIEGKGSIPNELNGILIKNGDDIDIGIPFFGYGNVISGNDGYGIELEGHNQNLTQKGIRIRNNEIGVIRHGVTSSMNSRGGIKLSDSRKVTIGGKLDSFENNVIAGNDTVGVYIVDTSVFNNLPPDSILILGNYIGLDESLNSIPNNGSGVFIDNAFEGGKVFIGKDSLAQRNIIAFNKGDGVGANGKRIISMEFNEFYDNEYLAIDLGFDGVSLNDEDDLDVGVNNGINFPKITNATYNKVDELLTLFASLETEPKVEQYFIDYYYNEECDASGYGEARYYLGTREVFTNVEGFAEDSSIIPLPYSEIDHLEGIYITTNTYSHKSGTSELSKCFYLALEGSGGNRPDLVLSKTDSLETVESIGSLPSFEYTLIVKNIGSITANEVTVTDSIPEVFTIGDISTTKGVINLTESVLTVEIDSLMAGDSLVVRIPVETGQEGIVINKAYASTIDDEPNLLNNVDSDTTEVTILVSVEEEREVPTEYLLHQNYPNPFNPNTTISYEVPERAYIEVIVFNLLGMKVATLVQEVKQPGTYTINWDASGYASDLYFYRLKAGGFIQTKKMTLIK